MLSILCSGKLLKDPKPGTSKNGNPYCTASLRVPVQANQEGETDAVFVSAIAFGEAAEKLSRLTSGDAVSLTGSAKLSHWTKDGKEQTGLNITVVDLLTAYALKRRRGEADRPKPEAKPAGTDSWQVYRQPVGDFDDAPNF
jgi:single-stranded DNA-binding protein